MILFNDHTLIELIILCLWFPLVQLFSAFLDILPPTGLLPIRGMSSLYFIEIVLLIFSFSAF